MTFFFQNSNIVEFFGLLKKDDPSKQMVYYQVRIFEVSQEETSPDIFCDHTGRNRDIYNTPNSNTYVREI